MIYHLNKILHLLLRFGSGQSVFVQRVISLGGQVALVLLANATAFMLRFEAKLSNEHLHLFLAGLPFVGLIFGAGLLVFGCELGLWRYTGFHDVKLLFIGSVVSTSALYLLLHLGLRWTAYPLSVIIMTGLLSVGGLSFIRVLFRFLSEWTLLAGSAVRRLMIIGAGNLGAALTRDLKVNSANQYQPVVFVDDNPAKHNRTINGVLVAGRMEDIPILAKRYAVNEIIIAISPISPLLMQRILKAADSCQLPIKALLSTRDILGSTISMQQTRLVKLEDLLQREPIQIDLQELHPLLSEKRVLVTGAGGSIGSELCRQIARYQPKVLVIFDHHENSLYELERELRASFTRVEIHAVVGDVTAGECVEATLKNYQPQMLFHAAAHKHVPLMEQNPEEAIRNNVIGTSIIAEASVLHGVERFVLISTDKAINPTNVMGATKRIAECIVRRMNGRGRTLFTVVRFGNVLGSNGSVVPLFAEQIKKGGPVTVSHPDIKRYFMTIPESVQLILQASVRSQGGDVFMLEMGEQIRILDLARNMIVLSGLVPDVDIKIIYTGLRPGEKLYEELYENGECVEATSHDKIKRITSRISVGAYEARWSVDEFEEALKRRDAGGILRQLQILVPTYRPSSDKRASRSF